MNRLLVTGVLALCLITSQIAHAEEDRNAKIKAEMVQNYLLWQEAYKNKDAGRIISFESPDFTHVFENRYTISKVQNDSNLYLQMDNLFNLYDAHVEIKKLTIEPNRIVILSNKSIILNSVSRPIRVSTTVHTRDIWVQYDRLWMLKRTEDLETSVTRTIPASH